MIQLAQQHHRIVAADNVEVARKIVQGGRGAGVFAGKKHLPVIAFGDESIEFAPGVRCEEIWDLSERLVLDKRLGDDDELLVLAGNVEVVNVVAEVVAIGENAAAGAD